jgi:hypothetical protein
MASDTQNQKLQQIVNYSLINSLEVMPGGECIALLKSKLDEKQLVEASHYILEIMLSLVFISLNDELQTVINNLIAQENYQDAMLLIVGLCGGKDVEATFLQLQLMKGMQIGFDVMCKRYNLKF